MDSEPWTSFSVTTVQQKYPRSLKEFEAECHRIFPRKLKCAAYMEYATAMGKRVGDERALPGAQCDPFKKSPLVPSDPEKVGNAQPGCGA